MFKSTILLVAIIFFILKFIKNIHGLKFNQLLFFFLDQLPVILLINQILLFFNL